MVFTTIQDRVSITIQNRVSFTIHDRVSIAIQDRVLSYSQDWVSIRKDRFQTRTGFQLTMKIRYQLNGKDMVFMSSQNRVAINI